jgi:hypothetical protein
MDKQAIERRLRGHILNLCLAVAGKQKNDIAVGKAFLVDEVERIVNDAKRQVLSAPRGGYGTRG